MFLPSTIVEAAAVLASAAGSLVPATRIPVNLFALAPLVLGVASFIGLGVAVEMTRRRRFVPKGRSGHEEHLDEAA